jgi:hypothetical protein
MNSVLRIPLTCNDEQHARLQALQHEFAQACNRVSDIARTHRCWNRVALHHLAYRMLREQFPNLGSQMACNAIYSVCRACRWAYQHPQSPLKAAADAGQPLAPIVFLNTAPVYFDRHTLSLSDGQLSMYTLDGRMHFQLSISEPDQQRFLNEKLKEVALTQAAAFAPKVALQTTTLTLQRIQLTPGTTIQLSPSGNSGFELVFWFEGAKVLPNSKQPSALELAPESQAVGPLTMQPPYLMATP